MVAETEKGLQVIMDRLNEVSKEYSMEDQCEKDKSYENFKWQNL